MTTDTKTTAQIALAAVAARDAALKSAIGRIKATMLPAARALAGTRTPESPYWLEVQRDLTTTGPFRGKTALIWRDQGRNNGAVREPYDAQYITYTVQVVHQDDITPAELAVLAQIAAVASEDLERKCLAQAKGLVAGYEDERAAFEAIGRA